ncbi:hypothetical protein BH10ACT11_BH10ACT11_02950 [soil metagenome]
MALATTLAALAMAGPGVAETPDLPWTDLLPGTPTANNPQPHPIPHCRKATSKCIDTEIRRLKALRDRLGCDHRGVFATTYLELTRQLRRDQRAGLIEGHYISPSYLYREDALFANVYFKIFRANNRGEPIPQAWRIAFDAADDGNYFGAQDMLLGINAHVQNDMPFVLAAQGLHTRSGASRKPDHDRFNQTLNRAFGPVVAAVRKRFDPSLDLTNPPSVPLDDVAGIQLVRGWREVVWRNAERLLNAKTKAEYNQVASSIEQYAAANATALSALFPPGYGTTRDAYCAAGPAGQG